MTVEEIVPATVAAAHGPISRSHNVGEQHAGQNAVGISNTANTGEELLDFVDQRVTVPGKWQVVATGQLDEAAVWDVIDQIARMLYCKHAVDPAQIPSIGRGGSGRVSAARVRRRLGSC